MLCVTSHAEELLLKIAELLTPHATLYVVMHREENLLSPMHGYLRWFSKSHQFDEECPSKRTFHGKSSTNIVLKLNLLMTSGMKNNKFWE